jgi:glycosyltransferase involved in cell wall biosynthesis
LTGTEKKHGRVRKKLSMGVLVFPRAAPTFEQFLFSYLDLLKQFCDEVYVVSGAIAPRHEYAHVTIHDVGTKLHYAQDVRPYWWSILLWIFRNAAIQMKMAAALYHARKTIDAVTFCGAEWILPSMVVAKLIKKRTAVLAWGASHVTYKKNPGRKKISETVLMSFTKLEGKITLNLADQINVEAPSAIRFLGLENHRHKIVINGGGYVDRDVFRAVKPVSERSRMIGYVGRLREEKGLMNFVRAIPLLRERFNDIAFTIIGEGALWGTARHELKLTESCEAVTMMGWVPHSDLPRYLNEFKLFVFPSYGEGLPRAVQEAMSCGAPVLATDVGGVPDLIKDGETGFIISVNSPEGIVEDATRILMHKNLAQVAANAEDVIEKEYVYELMAEKCGKALEKLMEPAV